MTIAQAVAHNASKPQAVKIRTFKHAVDRSNIRYPITTPNPLYIEASVTIRGNDIEVGHISYITMDTINTIRSFTALEQEIIEEAEALFLEPVK